jgi:hypothetical protein
MEQAFRSEDETLQERRRVLHAENAELRATLAARPTQIRAWAIAVLVLLLLALVGIPVAVGLATANDACDKAS